MPIYKPFSCMYCDTCMRTIQQGYGKNVLILHIRAKIVSILCANMYTCVYESNCIHRNISPAPEIAQMNRV